MLLHANNFKKINLEKQKKQSTISLKTIFTMETLYFRKTILVA
jgi:hypothetical protein